MSDKHPWRNEETLRKKYWDEGMTLHELANHFDTSYNRIREAFDDLGVKKRGKGGSTANTNYKDKDYLQTQYWEEYKSIQEIADECGCSKDTVQDWMDRHDIERRNGGRNAGAEYKDEELLRELYLEKELSSGEIAERFGVADWTILRWLRNYDIPVRDISRDTPRVFTRKNGYEVIRVCEDGEVVEVRLHRLIAVSEGILEPHEVTGRERHIHHESYIPWDNRPDNLSAVSGSEHIKIHNG